jgi:DNA helicase HerA-like ATPase
MKPLLLGHDAAERPIYVEPDARKIHMHVVGSSGSGKSKLLESMMREDLKHRQGFALLDPHGTLYDDLVAYCARHAPDREVVLLNLSRPDYIVGFNPFQKAPSGDISVQVDRRINATMHAWNVQNADETPTLARTLRLIYTVMIERGLGLPQIGHLIDFNARTPSTPKGCLGGLAKRCRQSSPRSLPKPRTGATGKGAIQHGEPL